MIVNADALARLYTALTAVFNRAFEVTETWYEKVAMTVPAKTRIMDYRFLLDLPMMREWVGDRQIRDVRAEAFIIETKDWEATIEVDRNDIEDDSIGLYTPLVQALAEGAKKHPDYLVAQLIKANGTCYDGQPFFSTAHPVGSATVSNYDSGAGPAWYLLDVSRAVRPFVFQLRRPVQLTRMDRPDDEHVFMRRKYRYGVDGRWAVGYGLWQLAYCSKAALTPDNYAAARAAMMSFTDAEGNPLGIRPNLLLVPPALEGAARTLLNAQFVIGDPTAGGSQTNIWQGTASLLVAPELA